VSDERVLHLRCSHNIAQPDDSGGHVRVDIGQPVPPALLHRLLSAIGTCACGGELVPLSESQADPWRRP